MDAASTSFYNALEANLLRYRGYIYDSETEFYYLQSRYYDPAVRRFINADGYVSTGTGIMGYNMFAYCNNNPVICSDNAGTSPAIVIAAAILLFTPIGGMVFQAATAMGCYAGTVIASIWDEDIRNDMEMIDWNLFNDNETSVLQAKKVSFYKGVPVFNTNLNRPGSFGVICLNYNASIETLQHEYGHNIQQIIMGPAKFGLMIALPSWREWSSRSYYERPWEITADIFGGVTNRTHSQRDLDRGNWYFAISSIFGVLGYFFLFGEY